MFRIIDKLEGNENFINEFGIVFIRDLNVSVRCYEETFIITHLKNAMKTWKFCTQFIISKSFIVSTSIDRRINFEKDISLKNKNITLSDFLSNPRPLNYKDDISLKTIQLKSIDIFSPFIEKPNTVNILKKQITLGDIKKMLMNDQIKEVVISKETTDDYSGDADCNFNKGKIIDKNEMCFELVQFNSGWRVCRNLGHGYIFENDNNEKWIEIACHHFKYVKCYINNTI